MNRRVVGTILVALAIAAGGTAISVSAYHAGFVHGVASHATTSVVYARGPGWGFFPFGILLFPLFLFLVFGGLRFALWGPRRYGRGWGGPGEHGSWGGGGPRERLEEWHRHAHDPEGSSHASQAEAPSSA